MPECNWTPEQIQALRDHVIQISALVEALQERVAAVETISALAADAAARASGPGRGP